MDILQLLLTVFSVYYITTILHFQHIGPFLSSELIVKVVISDPETEPRVVERPHHFFDYFRAVFGLYEIDGNVWAVRPERLQLWLCPVCLSFWVTVVMGLLLAMAPLEILGVTGFVSFIMSRE